MEKAWPIPLAPRYARAAAFADARAVITTMHTEARFPLKCESASLASEARNRALLPCDQLHSQ